MAVDVQLAVVSPALRLRAGAACAQALDLRNDIAALGLIKKVLADVAQGIGHIWRVIGFRLLPKIENCAFKRVFG